MKVDILSLFPEYFTSPLGCSILGKAIEKKLLKLNLLNLRDYSDNTRCVDDRPYGGGPGMLIRPQPVRDALKTIKDPGKSRVIYLSPQGQPLSGEIAKQLAKESHLILLCGHYEGIDQRVLDLEVDQSISIGDYVLTNGCLPALVLLDALARFLPGVLGNQETLEHESFENGLLDCPHYTRPESFEGVKVPQVLLEGNHQKIADWRHQQAIDKTKQVRPDLYLRYLGDAHFDSIVPSSEKEKRLAKDSSASVLVQVQNLAAMEKFLKKLGFCLSAPKAGIVLAQGAGLNLKLVLAKATPTYEFEIELEKALLAAICIRLKKEYTCQIVEASQVKVLDPEGNLWLLKEALVGSQSST